MAKEKVNKEVFFDKIAKKVIKKANRMDTNEPLLRKWPEKEKKKRLKLFQKAGISRAASSLAERRLLNLHKYHLDSNCIFGTVGN